MRKPSPPSAVRRPLPIWKKFLFGLIVCLGGLGLLEAGLWLLDLGRPSAAADPFVGFSGSHPLFVQTRAADGSSLWKTAPDKLTWFNSQSFPDHKPSGTYRIFCLGGSTTYGRPYDDATSFAGWLRTFLPAAQPQTDWEVINAGGISYASYRVARVAQELADKQPDLLIVYTGHNEFLERRTYAGLAETPAVVREAAGWLMRFRIYAALQSLTTAAPASESKQDILPAEVETLLDSSVGLDAYHRDRELHQNVARHFRGNLERIVAIARSAGADVVLVTPASQLRECRPFKSEHRADLQPVEAAEFDAAMGTADEALQRGEREQALTHLDEAVAIDEEYALAHYRRGSVLWSLQRYDEARPALQRALDEDVCPLRARKELVEIVRQVAREHNVPLVDFVALAAERAEQGVPGSDLFLDHVHPTIEMHRQLALALIQTLQQMHILQPSPGWDETTIAEVTARIEGAIDPQAHARALLNLSKVLSWAGKTDEADRLAKLASEQLAEDPDALYQAGSARYRAGDLNGALELFERSIAASPGFGPAHFGIGLVLSETGRPQEAIRFYRRSAELQPRQLEVRFNLANALTSVGDAAAAEQEFRAALDISSGFAPAWNGLGIALAQQGHPTEAAEAFRTAVSLAPDNADFQANLQRALRAGETSK